MLVQAGMGYLFMVSILQMPSSTRDLEALLPPIATKLMAADRLETPEDSHGEILQDSKYVKIGSKVRTWNQMFIKLEI